MWRGRWGWGDPTSARSPSRRPTGPNPSETELFDQAVASVVSSDRVGGGWGSAVEDAFCYAGRSSMMSALLVASSGQGVRLPLACAPGQRSEPVNKVHSLASLLPWRGRGTAL